MSKKIILVTGATGAQGGSVVRHLLQDGTFAVRALVRNPDSDASKQLSQQGVDIRKGDLNDADSIGNAFDGVYGVFGVTNFWDAVSGGYDNEIKQAKILGDAAKKAGVQHFVHSSLDRNSNVPHFESKVIGEDYIRSLGVPLTVLVTSFYYENFKSFFPPKLVDDVLVFSAPVNGNKTVPIYAAYDNGGWVLNAFLHPEKYLNKDVSAVSQYISFNDLVSTFSKVTGKKARFDEIPKDYFKSLGFPGAEELVANFQFFEDIHDKVKEDRRVNLETSQTIFKGEQWEEYIKRAKFYTEDQ